MSEKALKVDIKFHFSSEFAVVGIYLFYWLATSQYTPTLKSCRRSFSFRWAAYAAVGKSLELHG